MATITQVWVSLSKKKFHPSAFRVNTDFNLDPAKTWKVTISDPSGNHTWGGYIIPDDGPAPITSATVYAIHLRGVAFDGARTEETGQITVVIADTAPGGVQSTALILPATIEP